MEVQLSKSNSLSIARTKYAALFCGEPLDERGHCAIQGLSILSDVHHVLKYDVSENLLTLNGTSLSPIQLNNIFDTLENQYIALETTTLGFVELYMCCRAAVGRTRAMDCIYVEPRHYRRSFDSHLMAKRDFELSGEIVGFRGIPGATRMLDERQKQRYVFFVGYEGARIRRAFTDLEQLKGQNAEVVFGVPAFKSGWEMDSFANNVNVIQDEQIPTINYCGADNPRAAA